MSGSKKFSILAFFTAGALMTASCGGDDDGGGGGSCGSVCACVVSAGGDNDTCQSECASVVNSGGNQRQGCETRLDLWGYPQCKPECAKFPTS